MSAPLIESDLAVLAILLALLGVCALVAYVLERREWFKHSVRPNVLPPPNPRTVVRARWNVPN